MRKLMALTAIVFLAASARSWALVGLENVSYDGSLEFSGQSAKNEVDFNDDSGDHRGGVNSRLRVGVNATVTEDVKGRLEFVRTGGQFGRNLAGAQGAANSIDNETAAILIQNAYIDLDNLWGLKWRLGRQYVGEPGDLVWRIGPREDDALLVNAIDGLLVQSRKWDALQIDVFDGKAKENDALAVTDLGEVGGDVNLADVDVMLPTVIPGGKIRIGYLSGKMDIPAGSNSLQIYRVGAMGGISENMFTYRGEILVNGGENNSTGSKVNYKGNAIDLGVGFNSPETGAGTFGLAADFTRASGDDDSTNKDDKSFHDFLALGVVTTDRYYGEIFGRDNAVSPVPLGQGLDTSFTSGTGQGLGIQILHLGLVYKPAMAPKYWGRLDWYDFAAAEDSQRLVAGGPSVSIGDYGSEIDLTVGYKHSDNVGIEGGYAMFSPDDALTGGSPAPDDDVQKLFARLKVKWGGEETMTK